MQAQSFVGHKNSNPRLSDRLLRYDLSTSELLDSFSNLLTTQDSKLFRKKIDITKKKIPDSETQRIAQKTRLQDIIQLKFCETLILGKTIRQTCCQPKSPLPPHPRLRLSYNITQPSFLYVLFAHSLSKSRCHYFLESGTLLNTEENQALLAVRLQV